MSVPPRTAAIRLLLGAVLCAVAACAVAADFEDQVSDALRYQLSGAAESWAGSALDWKDLRAFYGARDFRAVWCEAGGLDARGRALVRTLRQADTQGLDPQRYHLQAIDAQCRRRSAPERAWLDLLLTDAFFRYSVDVRGGRQDPREADPDWYLQGPDVHPVALLASALEGTEAFNTVLRELPPPQPAYRRLRAALARYRQIADAGGWPALPPGPTIKPGMTDPRVPLLRQRLRISGDLPAGDAPDPERYGDALKAAVERFQRRLGLAVDALVGPRVRAALNVPAAARVEQIRLNMERRRWLPRDLGERYVMVNMAGFDLRLVEQGRTVLEMPVIVGRTYRSTPAFSDRLRYLVLNPDWTVPPRIAVKDLLPKEQADPGYFDAHGITVFDGWGAEAGTVDASTVDWSSYGPGHFPFKLVQQPGPQNPLGRIKFMFPNRFDVYLHDTPARELFSRPVRTFSSGCIRLARPLELAARLLSTPDKPWAAADVQAAIDADGTRNLTLPSPVPIYLVYWTAWADARGVVHFRDDIYGRDRRMAEDANGGNVNPRTQPAAQLQ